MIPRRTFVRGLVGVLASPLAACRSGEAAKVAERDTVMESRSARMPTLFVGHGSPMNAIVDNAWSRGFQELAATIPTTPRAIVAVSAHWYTRGTHVTGQERPPTIHDFGGFPDELFAVRYDAPGSPALASRIAELLGPGVDARMDWGLDHGTWSVLRHLRPEADVPVVQLSIDAGLPAEAHVAIGRRLAPLRDEGVLVLGSGNVTHNLRHAFGVMRGGEATTPDWAGRFDAEVVRAVDQHDGAALSRLLATSDGRMSHPSPDHYLPLLYVVGAANDADAVTYPIRGFDAGSLSMRSIRFG